MGGPDFTTVADSAAAAAFVAARVAEGSDFIKIIYDDLETLEMVWSDEAFRICGFEPIPGPVSDTCTATSWHDCCTSR